MKKPLMILSMLTMALLVIFTACKKDDDDEAKTPADYLTAHSWTLKSMEVDPVISIYGLYTISDLFETVTIPGYGTFSIVDECYHDDMYYFNTDGTVTIDTGSDHCEDDEAQQEDGGTWEISDDGQTISLGDSLEIPTTGTISTLDDNNFIVITTISEDFGFGLEDYSITMHFVK